ncbi:hypothetical protein SAMN04488051_1207, partial [Alkalimonas amylolytica]
PLNMQNYNRYSYVLNNPMSYTDPSGYNFVKKALKGVMEATGTRKVLRELGRNQYLNAAVQIGVCIAGGPVACGAYAGAQSFAMTGSLGAGLRSGLITFGTAWTFQQIGGSYSDLSAANVDNVVFNGAQLGSYLDFGGNLLTAGQVAGQIFSHAMVGGVSASLQGGKFGHGFFSAGVTKGLGTPLMDASFAQNVVGGTVISATIGGTASVIAGGKFANGAVTGAMQALYNNYRNYRAEMKTINAVKEMAKILDQRLSIEEMLDALSPEQTILLGRALDVSMLTSGKGSHEINKYIISRHFSYTALNQSLGLAAQAGQGVHQFYGDAALGRLMKVALPANVYRAYEYKERLDKVDDIYHIVNGGG